MNCRVTNRFSLFFFSFYCKPSIQDKMKNTPIEYNLISNVAHTKKLLFNVSVEFKLTN